MKMIPKLKRWLLYGGFFVLTTVACYSLNSYLEYRAMHAIPAGLSGFNVNDPIPRCARWKDHMPATRDPNVYQRYIAARKLWRSKIEWQLTLQEAQSIFTDVNFAAEKGDWGAKALLAYLSDRPGTSAIQPCSGYKCK